MKSAKSVQRSEPSASKSERDATASAAKDRTERQIANDLKRRDRTQAQKPAYLKVSNAGDPRAERGATISTTRTLSATTLTRALVIPTWVKPQPRRRNTPVLAQEARTKPVLAQKARTKHHSREQRSPPRKQRAQLRPARSDYATSVPAKTTSRTLAHKRSKTSRELGKPSQKTGILWPYGTKNSSQQRKSNVPTESWMHGTTQTSALYAFNRWKLGIGARKKTPPSTIKWLTYDKPSNDRYSSSRSRGRMKDKPVP